jgi:predicted  nucleic acid-binding Zn-ribbon protein
MSGPAALLREIHRLRRHARELQTRIEKGPLALKAQQDKLVKQEAALHQAQDELKRLKVMTHDKEVSLKTAQQQIAKYQKQLNEAASKKEYDALQHEIAAARKSVSQLEDEILDAMAATEERTAQVPELTRALQQARDELAKFERDHQARLAGFAEQRQQALQNATQIEAGLPPDIRPNYDRLMTVRGDDALSVVENRTCMACYTEITPQNFQELSRGQFVLCKSCGRILYMPE